MLRNIDIESSGHNIKVENVNIVTFDSSNLSFEDEFHNFLDNLDRVTDGRLGENDVKFYFKSARVIFHGKRVPKEEVLSVIDRYFEDYFTSQEIKKLLKEKDSYVKIIEQYQNKINDIDIQLNDLKN